MKVYVVLYDLENVGNGVESVHETETGAIEQVKKMIDEHMDADGFEVDDQSPAGKERYAELDEAIYWQEFEVEV